jgi:hypothetical protein
MLHQVMQHTAASHERVANGIEKSNQIAAAPRKAVIDPHTKRIVGSEIVQPQGQPA